MLKQQSKNNPKESELSPDARNIRLGGSDIIGLIVKRRIEIDAAKIPDPAKFRLLDQMADEVEHLINRLTTTLVKLDDTAGKYSAETANKEN